MKRKFKIPPISEIEHVRYAMHDCQTIDEINHSSLELIEYGINLIAINQGKVERLRELGKITQFNNFVDHGIICNYHDNLLTNPKP